LLHRRVYIAISSWKLLLNQFCEKPLHITFKKGWDYWVLLSLVSPWVLSSRPTSGLPWLDERPVHIGPGLSWSNCRKKTLIKQELNDCVDIGSSAFTVLIWHQEGHRPCTNWVIRCWRSYLPKVRCTWFADGTATSSSFASLKSRLA